MKLIDKLNSKDKLLLVNLYETDSYKAMQRLIVLSRSSLADKCLVLQGDIETLRFLQGQAKSLEDLQGVIREVYQDYQKNENRKLKD